MDWLDLLAVQRTLKSLLQQHSSKASILWCSTFFTVQLSHPYMTTGVLQLMGSQRVGHDWAQHTADLQYCVSFRCTAKWFGFYKYIDSDCSHEIKRHLLLGRKVMTDLESMLKSRDITLPPKVHLVKAMVLPVVTYGCESWTVKKVEHQRIYAFELRCWRRLLRVSLDCTEI